MEILVLVLCVETPSQLRAAEKPIQQKPLHTFRTDLLGFSPYSWSLLCWSPHYNTQPLDRGKDPGFQTKVSKGLLRNRSGCQGCWQRTEGEARDPRLLASCRILPVFLGSAQPTSRGRKGAKCPNNPVCLLGL